MKKLNMLLVALSIAYFADAQWVTSGNNIYNTNTGNVGIGTSAPGVKLDVVGAVRTSNIYLYNNADNVITSINNGNTYPLIGSYSGWDTKAIYVAGYNAGNATASGYATATERVYIGNPTFNSNYLSVNLLNGNVGIGTSSAQAKLDVAGQALLLTGDHRIYINESVAFDPQKAGFRNNQGNLVVNAKDGGVLYLNRDVNADTRIQSTIGTSTIDIAVFKSNGTVGIGTDNTGSFKLAVEGKIGAREVRVTAASPWPDYVFSRSYKLPNLTSVEDYIKKHSHLPEMPSAQEVKDNGIELGQMNAKLLQKIEEITLYVIDLKKETTQLKKENAQLRAMIQKRN